MKNFTIHKCKTKITAFNKANVTKIVQKCLAMIWMHSWVWRIYDIIGITFYITKIPSNSTHFLNWTSVKKDLFLLMFPQSWHPPSELPCVCVSFFMVKQLFEHNCSNFGSDSVSITIGPYPHHSNHVFKINFVLYVRVWKKTRYF